MVRDVESAGSLKFVIVTNRPADVSFTVQVCTENITVGLDLDMATGWVYNITQNSYCKASLIVCVFKLMWYCDLRCLQ